MRRFLKTLLWIGGGVVFFSTSFTLMPVLVASFVAVKAVDLVGSIIDWRRGRRSNLNVSVSEEQLQYNKRKHKLDSERNFYDGRKRQWNLRELPLGLEPIEDFEKTRNRCSSLFRYNGVEGVVYGEYNHGRAEFSLVTGSEHYAQKIQEFIDKNGIIGTRICHTDKGYEIISDNAVHICELVKEFYPSRTMEVKRSVTTTRQYIVPGCRSYEEAKAKFEQNRMYYAPINTYSTVQDCVDGVMCPAEGKDRRYVPNSLEAGQFIIDDSSVEVYSRKVTFPGGKDCTDEALRSEASAAYKAEDMGHEDLVEDECRKDIVSNGLDGVAVKRTLCVDGEEIPFCTSKNYDMSLTGAQMVVTLGSLKEVRELVDGNMSLKDLQVLLDNAPDPAAPGEYVITVPVTNELASCMKLCSTLPDECMKEYGYLGLTEDEMQFSSIVREISSDGFANVRLTDVPSLDGACINGMSLDEFAELDRERQFKSEAQAQQWMKDAAAVQSVHMQLDIKNRALYITSTVAVEDRMETKTEKRDLTSSEVQMMARREDLTQSELKDLVIMMHPSYFNTYSKDGKPMYEDPLGAYIRGEKPKMLKERTATEAKSRNQVKKPSGKSQIKM